MPGPPNMGDACPSRFEATKVGARGKSESGMRHSALDGEQQCRLVPLGGKRLICDLHHTSLHSGARWT